MMLGAPADEGFARDDLGAARAHRGRARAPSCRRRAWRCCTQPAEADRRGRRRRRAARRARAEFVGRAVRARRGGRQRRHRRQSPGDDDDHAQGGLRPVCAPRPLGTDFGCVTRERYIILYFPFEHVAARSAHGASAPVFFFLNGVAPIARASCGTECRHLAGSACSASPRRSNTACPTGSRSGVHRVRVDGSRARAGCCAGERAGGACGFTPLLDPSCAVMVTRLRGRTATLGLEHKEHRGIHVGRGIHGQHRGRQARAQESGPDERSRVGTDSGGACGEPTNPSCRRMSWPGRRGASWRACCRTRSCSRACCASGSRGGGASGTSATSCCAGRTSSTTRAARRAPRRRRARAACSRSRRGARSAKSRR